MTLTCIFAATFPLSEIATGGNYNLRYLSGEYRRDLRPQISAYHKAAETVAGRPFPPYALVPGVPISLYIPRAGFLWADDLVWDIDSGNFKPEGEIADIPIGIQEKNLDHLVNPQPRIIFSDQFGTVGPWFFEQTRDGDYNWADNVLTSRVWPGQSVYLRNFQTGEFVTASMEGMTITDMYDEKPDDTIRRLYISAAPEPAPTSKWRAMYNPHKNDGFRLWNTEANCFLATSYRTYPNLHGSASNETILWTLDLELEACCTYPPSREASTFYAIDGVEKPSPSSTWLPFSFGRFTMYEMRLRGHFSFTIGILRAMFNLYLFRKKHAAVQEMSSQLTGLHNGVPYTERWTQVFVAVVAGSTLFSLSQAMYAKREGSARCSERMGPKQFCSFASWVQFYYLVFFVVKSTLLREQLWDSQFILGVALIHTVDRVGLVRAT